MNNANKVMFLDELLKAVAAAPEEQFKELTFFIDNLSFSLTRNAAEELENYARWMNNLLIIIRGMR